MALIDAPVQSLLYNREASELLLEFPFYWQSLRSFIIKTGFLIFPSFLLFIFSSLDKLDSSSLFHRSR